MINEEYIIIGKNFKDTAELFGYVSQILVQKNIVDTGYSHALSAREKEYPTGLDTGKIKIAIPHADSSLVKKEALAVAVPQKPVIFREMGNPSAEIKADIIFFPLVMGRQAKFLANLLNNIRNSDILNHIYNSRNRQEICRLLKKFLNI
ncbi:MAG: PTS sugar transporter subunit IIA [Actinomycetota bacterium]